MRDVYIGSAWPYVNGPLHLGHVAGLVPADFLARYHRLVGDNVLWTSGSDCHGTPITQRAAKEDVSSREIAERFHKLAAETFARLGFSYSLYWATMEAAHYERVQDSFLQLFEQGLIIEDDFSLAHCTHCNENRADREVVGICPECMSREARGDQCEACGQNLHPDQLASPKCSTCFKPITFETTRELFLNLPAVSDKLTKWVAEQTHWRDNAKQWTEGWLRKGLTARCITRDIDWGIPVPLDEWKHRRIYVWFEAVHGYLTASMQWAIDQGTPDAWKPFWDPNNPNAISYYVIGKDNIPFHSLIWPAILLGRDLRLPWHIVSSEYLGLEGEPLSTSKNWAIWAPDFLDRYPSDSLRFFLTINGPEKKDTDFTWEGFVTRYNNELANNWGNLAQRVLKFADKRCDGKIPQGHDLASEDATLLADIQNTFSSVGELIETTEFRKAIVAIMSLVQRTNQYWNNAQPWAVIKTDPERANTIISTALHAVGAIAILTEPFMPDQAEKVRTMLGGIADRSWTMPNLPAGQKFGEITVLFEKLDPSVIDEELERLKAQTSS